MKQFPTLLAVSLFLFVHTASDAAARPLYKIVDKRGNITFSSKKPRGGVKYQLFRAKRAYYSKIYRSGSSRGWIFRPQDSPYDDTIIQIANKNGLSPALVKAVIHVESAFLEKARSPKGAQGLMQLMPKTAKQLGVSNPFEAKQNVEGGSKYLKTLLARYNGSLELALAAYNAGEGAVNKYSGIPPYKETLNYVSRVKTAYRSYRQNFH